MIGKGEKMTKAMNIIEQLRQVEESLARISRMKTMPDHRYNTATLVAAHHEAQQALALMPGIIASVEEMGKPAPKPDVSLPTSLAECKSADEYNALLDRRLAAKATDTVNALLENEQSLWRASERESGTLNGDDMLELWAVADTAISKPGTLSEEDVSEIIRAFDEAGFAVRRRG